ncbi:HupE/UreJ family protein [Variovorax sp. GT1P44]|uniref:HupE/UreJ family protein n=1 Tax=Variovorax sp. GT1P44 TaxID=3443742 RepID=UPI003F44A57E
MSVIRWLLGLLVACCCLGTAQAHDSRPAYLEITETAQGRYDVLWRTPLTAGARLPVELQFPDDVRTIAAPSERTFPDSVVERRIIEVPSGLGGRRVEVVGLQGTITDVLARVQTADGASSTSLIRPSMPWLEVAVSRGRGATAITFLKQGIEHIVLGVDHLLFVFGLLLLVRSPWMLFKTITAFTVAHSITLALATLGGVNVPALPLNASIALSILFLGPEVIKARRGESTFTIRHPWVVAFMFGLLHGLGFASGLVHVGLPARDIPLALLMFNIGVEIGQLAFVGLMLLTVRAFKALDIVWPPWARLAPAYVVGSLGAFWTVQRVMLMLPGAQ